MGHTATVSKFNSSTGKFESVQGVVKSVGFDSSGNCAISINGQNYALSDVISVQDGAAGSGSTGGTVDSGSADGSDAGGTADTGGSQSGA